MKLFRWLTINIREKSMGIFKVLTYPISAPYNKYVQAKTLAYCYDVAGRLVKDFKLPKWIVDRGEIKKHHLVIGQKLLQEIIGRKLLLDGPSLAGESAAVLAAIAAVLPEGAAGLTLEKLAELRIIREGQGTFRQRVARVYDAFVPVKRFQAVDTLISETIELPSSLTTMQDQLAAFDTYKQQLVDKFQAELQKVKLLERGHKAYHEIMSAVYRTDPRKDPMTNIIEMLNVVTKWAHQVIGRSPNSEAAGWVAVSRDGKVGVTYKYMIAEQGLALATAPLYTLKKAGAGGTSLGLALTDEQSPVIINDKKLGNFMAIKEWEGIKLREDLVIVEGEDGGRTMYRRELQPGSKMVNYLVKGKTGETVGSLLGAFAQAATAVAGMITNLDNAFVDLIPVEPAAAGLLPGEVIPFVEEGTSIRLVSAGSRNPNLREEKIHKGTAIEAACKKGGLEIGIVNQTLAKAIGNVRTAALVPRSYMIMNTDKFGVRAQNNFLIKIVGVKSYFIRTLLEFNEQGEAVCLGCLEVTNPEIIPDKMGEEDKKNLMEQFQAGQIFAEMASTGIMIKILQEEINNLSRQYLGLKVYQLIKERNFSALNGIKVNDATVMFADISGFTALSDKLKDMPDQVVSMLSKIFSRLDPIVDRNGGRVDKHDGDCILADFGVPKSEATEAENAERSVTAAIEMQLELQKVNLRADMIRFYQQHGLKPLGITIGLNTGMVIAGNLGYEGSKVEFSIIGDAVNQASRLQHGISRGQVLIGETTYQLLSSDYKQRLVAEFNAYNRDIRLIKKMVLAEYQRMGRAVNEAELDAQLQQYSAAYQDVTEEDLFVPAVSWAKNKGVIPSYFVRWDRHYYRYQFLKAAGIELPDRSSFENQPSSIEETKAEIYSDSYDNVIQLEMKKRQELRAGFAGFLQRRAARPKKTSTAS